MNTRQTYYQKNKDKISAKAKEYYQKNIDKIKESQKAYYQKGNNRILQRIRSFKYYHYGNGKKASEKYTKSEKARKSWRRNWHNNLKKCTLRRMTRYYNKKKTICEICNSKAKTQFHHISYEPNIFIEVCRDCHNKQHKRVTRK